MWRTSREESLRAAAQHARAMRSESRLRTALEAALAGLAVMALAWISITVTVGAGRAAAIWPANAVILACLIRRRPGRWPVFVLAGFAGNLAANFLVGDAPAVAVGLSVCNAAEILICALGLRRL